MCARKRWSSAAITACAAACEIASRPTQTCACDLTGICCCSIIAVTGGSTYRSKATAPTLASTPAMASAASVARIRRTTNRAGCFGFAFLRGRLARRATSLPPVASAAGSSRPRLRAPAGNAGGHYRNTKAAAARRVSARRPAAERNALQSSTRVDRRATRIVRNRHWTRETTLTENHPAITETERERWERRYREGAYAERTHPTAFLAEWEPRLPRGRALDVACGAGRNALFLASTGRRVDALDISPTALARGRAAAASRGLEIRWIEADLDPDPDAVLPEGPYDLIVVVRYVHRGILAPLWKRLAPGGALLCEQHVDSTQEVVGPRHADFRMRPNELLRAVLALGPDVEVRDYREGVVLDPDGRRAALAQIVSFRGDKR
nr:hypothetical protein [Gammaproteobacteria bacterium]